MEVQTAASAHTRGITAAKYAAEAIFAAILLLALASRGPRPELAFWPLVFVMALGACGPPLLLPGRAEAAAVGRLATAAAATLLLQLRTPISVPGLSIESPMGETLGLSAHAPLLLALGVLAALPRQRDEANPALRHALAWAIGGLVAFCLLCFALMDRGLRAMPGGESMFYAETASAVSAVAAFGIILAYLLTVDDRRRLARLALASAAGLVLWGLLPPGVGA